MTIGATLFGRWIAASFLFLGTSACASTAIPPPAALTLEVYTAGENSYGVTSTILYGAHEAMLVDAQFRDEDAERLADRIDAVGRRLTTIFVTHPDADHLVGLGVLHRRFPAAHIYMTSAAIKSYRKTIGAVREQFLRHSRAQEAPPFEPLAAELPRPTLNVDGQKIEIIPDLQGDVAEAPVDSAVWIPSLRALVAGDVAFQDVHLYLIDSTPEGRAAWRAALRRLEAMRPTTVIAGHKRDAARQDTPDVLEQCRAYLDTVDRRLQQSSDAVAFESAMRRDFPDFGFPIFLTLSARSLYHTAAR